MFGAHASEECRRPGGQEARCFPSRSPCCKGEQLGDTLGEPVCRMRQITDLFQTEQPAVTLIVTMLVEDRRKKCGLDWPRRARSCLKRLGTEYFPTRVARAVGVPLCAAKSPPRLLLLYRSCCTDRAPWQQSNNRIQQLSHHCVRLRPNLSVTISTA